MEHENKYQKIGDVTNMDVDLDAVRKIPVEMALRYRILGVQMEGDILTGSV